MRGDPNAAAVSLSKLFEHMLSKQPAGDELERRLKAAGAMDEAMGDEWRDIIADSDIADSRSMQDVLEKAPLEADDEADELDEMFQDARKLAEEARIPAEQLEFKQSEESESEPEEECGPEDMPAMKERPAEMQIILVMPSTGKPSKDGKSDAKSAIMKLLEKMK